MEALRRSVIGRLNRTINHRRYTPLNPFLAVAALLTCNGSYHFVSGLPKVVKAGRMNTANARVLIFIKGDHTTRNATRNVKKGRA